jgi:hypothetical protein
VADLRVDIAAEFVGKKAFKDAYRATSGLEKQIGRLGKQIASVFAVGSIVAFSRAAVKAALDQQAQQQRLTALLKTTLAASTDQIASLNSQANALEKIGVVTGENITQTQSQLATFNLQISTIKTLTPAILDYVTAEKGATASTADFKSMTNGLAQALNGNFASLTRVGFVIDDNTKKTIKSGSETERAAALVKVLDSTYKNFNKNLRATPSGQMQVLAESAQKAKEIIGVGLLNAVKNLGDDNSVEQLGKDMQSLATYTADVIKGIGKLSEKLKIGGLTRDAAGNFDPAGLIQLIPILGSYINILRESGAKAQSTGFNFFGSPMEALQKKREEDKARLTQRKILQDQLKINKAEKAREASLKKQAALKKAGTLFDEDQIQIIAALKGKLSDEDRKRLELQFALLVGNEKEATRLTLEIARAQGLGENLARFLASLPAAKNPFASWEAYLDMLMEKARKLGTVTSSSTAASATASSQAAAAAAVIAAPAFVGTPFGQAGSAAATALGTPFGQAGSAPSTNVVPFVGTPFGQAGGNGSGFIGTPFGQSIELKITGEGDITNAIAKGLQNQSLSTGTTTTINRSGGFL